MDAKLEKAIDAIRAIDLMVGNSLMNHALKAYALQLLQEVKVDRDAKRFIHGEKAKKHIHDWRSGYGPSGSMIGYCSMPSCGAWQENGVIHND